MHCVADFQMRLKLYAFYILSLSFYQNARVYRFSSVWGCSCNSLGPWTLKRHYVAYLEEWAFSIKILGSN